MDIRYKIKTAAVFSPVSVEELKRQLRIEHNDMDALLTELLARAVDASQNNTGRQYARATMLAYLDGFPPSASLGGQASLGGREEIEIDRGPVDEITSVKYLKPGESVFTELDASKYQLDNVDLTARLRFLEGFTTDSSRMNTVEIEFTAGWETAAEVPKELVEAIILRATDGYLHPENQVLNFGMSVATRAADIKERNFKVVRY